MREVRVHRRGEGRLPGPAAVPDTPGVARGLLRLAGAPAGAPGVGGRPVGSRDRGDPCREPAALRQPADSRGAGGPRLPHGEEARGAPDAGPRVGRPAPGLLHHSDRGSQYASGDYQRMLAQHGIVCSMSRRGDCWDNAVAESFFATLKIELVHDAAWATRAAARTALFDYLERFYNGQRRHSALGYLSPRAFEQQRNHEALAT